MNYEAVFLGAESAVVGLRCDGSVAAGFFVDPRGLLLTCFHAVRHERNVLIIRHDSREIKGRVARVLRRVDLAFVLAPPGPYAALELGNSEMVRVGSEVATVGYPRGLANTLSRGVVSGLGRLCRQVPHIQTDCAINGGSSGGPVLNEEGKVVGIASNSMAQSEGLHFAVPAEFGAAALEELQLGFERIPGAHYCADCGRIDFDSGSFCIGCGSRCVEPVAGPRWEGREVIGSGDVDCRPQLCVACGHQLAATRRYCPRCGAFLAAANCAKGKDRWDFALELVRLRATTDCNA